tara:strand:+ start:731 stop:916 length:186 start_codon:yes stop_codon:yes gene_type:complete
MQQHFKDNVASGIVILILSLILGFGVSIDSRLDQLEKDVLSIKYKIHPDKELVLRELVLLE